LKEDVEQEDVEEDEEGPNWYKIMKRCKSIHLRTVAITMKIKLSKNCSATLRFNFEFIREQEKKYRSRSTTSN